MSENHSRRDVLLEAAAGAAAFVLATNAALAEDKGSHDGHGSHDGTVAVDGSKSAHSDLVEKALACVAAGETCHAHCLVELGKGDPALKDCMARVGEMLPMCAALARFAASDAPRLKDLAKLCIDICDDCEKECRKHEKHHEVCKDCAEACADCSKECRNLI
jgi:Cys-rich four helix bundle protein (predicted Tat secretion target)